MALLKAHELTADPWTVVDGTGDPSGVDHPLITLESWVLHSDKLGSVNTPLGIFLKSHQSPVELVGDLDRFSVIALDFPKLSDGRAFSYARLLRQRYGFQGEVRAVGEVRRDQYLFMLRCGFNAFEVGDEVDLSGWADAATEVSVFYQPGSDDSSWAFRCRRS